MYSEPKEALLDVEINVNNHPLTYVEEDIQLNVLTPNSMILGRLAQEKTIICRSKKKTEVMERGILSCS